LPGGGGGIEPALGQFESNHFWARKKEKTIRGQETKNHRMIGLFLSIFFFDLVFCGRGGEQKTKKEKKNRAPKICTPTKKKTPWGGT